MNILTASNTLYEWYSENDTFNMRRDSKKALKEKDDEESRACLRCALDDFEKMEMIKSSQDGGEEYWVLRRSFMAFPQSIEILPSTALSIAQLINGFCDIIHDDTDTCDVKEIKEKDINNLIFICTHLIQEGQQQGRQQGKKNKKQ